MIVHTKSHYCGWKVFTLENDSGMSVRFLDFGGIITEINVPDRYQQTKNVVLGFEDYADYKNNTCYLGALIGPVAGRIEGSSFTIDNHEYSLQPNSDVHHLHGGSNGFHQILWEGQTFHKKDAIGAVLTYTSKDGMDGYPGNVHVSVTYTLTNDNEFIIDYSALSDKSTVLSLTNHSYFNLSGDEGTTIENHYVQIDSDSFLEVDHDLIATGRKLSVLNTPFDFQNGRTLADGIESSFPQNVIVRGGYDHYFLFNRKEAHDIVVHDEISGRKLMIQSNQPGVVMYTSNSLEEGLNLSKGLSKRHMGVCFETQASPASLHHDGFPTVKLKANVHYEKRTVYAFGLTE